MCDSLEHPTKYFDASPLFQQNSMHYDNIYEGGSNVEYRSIPVTKTFGNANASGALCENACGVKEVNIESIVRHNYQKTNSIGDVEFISGFPKQNSKPDAKLAQKPIQRKQDSDHGTIGRIRQRSLSEPNLVEAKDRGDSVLFQDRFNDDENFIIDNFADGENLQSENGGLKACIYIKQGGKVYKSKVKAINFQPDESGVFGDESKNHTYAKNESHSRSVLKREEDKFSSMLGTNSFKLKNEKDDFEIAILLSDLKNFSFGRQKKPHDDKMEESGKEIRHVKKSKKERDIRRFKDKRFETVQKRYPVPSKILKINDSNNSSCSRLTYSVRKSYVDLDFSSKESDDYEYNENINIVKRRPNVGSDRILGTRVDSIKNSKSNNLESRYRSEKSDYKNFRSSVISQSSISQGSGIYRIPKSQINDEILWEKFEFIFRNYATTNLHSGEVIPRKISTQWMTDAGVVDEFLTEKEANDAFRNAAGAKITMNAQEYKGFLIMLSLRMKLPYYEIYRRMCGMCRMEEK